MGQEALDALWVLDQSAQPQLAAALGAGGSRLPECARLEQPPRPVTTTLPFGTRRAQATPGSSGACAWSQPASSASGSGGGFGKMRGRSLLAGASTPESSPPCPRRTGGADVRGRL